MNLGYKSTVTRLIVMWIHSNIRENKRHNGNTTLKCKTHIGKTKATTEVVVADADDHAVKLDAATKVLRIA